MQEWESERYASLQTSSSEVVDDSSVQKIEKLTFFEYFKFLYDYKVTLIILLIWGIGHNRPSLLWGYYNNEEYFNTFIRDPFLYIIIPAVLILTWVVRYGIDSMKDFCYGEECWWR